MLKPLKNDQGLVLVVVLMIVIVMTTLTLSLLSLNISQVQVAEREVERIQSESIGTGMLDRMFALKQADDAYNTPITNSEIYDSTTFNSSVSSINNPSADPLEQSLAPDIITSVVTIEN